eukprot:TRINITY_DN1712_c0_g1_i3.p1 TRINITY_DN1712_c0_g1~~TRINITY_DN1712_c0_g1_i3.p1  ORF type:complete len:164 (+),score=41.06 TRINITY_DN1712_c0_g1_i3:66-557(+)
MCIRDRYQRRVHGELKEQKRMKNFVIAALVICGLAFQLNAFDAWEGTYDVSDDCSSVSCSRQSYKLIFNGKEKEYSIACPKAGKSIANISRIGATYVLKMKTYNMMKSDGEIVMELQQNNGYLEFIHKGKTSWVIRFNPETLIVDRSLHNGNDKCNFRMTRVQ